MAGIDQESQAIDGSQENPIATQLHADEQALSQIGKPNHERQNPEGRMAANPIAGNTSGVFRRAGQLGAGLIRTPAPDNKVPDSAKKTPPVSEMIASKHERQNRK